MTRTWDGRSGADALQRRRPCAVSVFIKETTPQSGTMTKPMVMPMQGSERAARSTVFNSGAPASPSWSQPGPFTSAFDPSTLMEGKK